jgi:uncharacterized linocin/CFP29 family protein
VGLNRDLAPISAEAWSEIESEARQVLAVHMAARRIMDFEGPLGWDHSALDLGRVETLEGGPKGALIRRRRVRPLLELRVPFTLRRSEIDGIDRGARDADLDPLREAARLFAAAEDTALFEGYADGDIPGIVGDAGHAALELPAEGVHLPDTVTRAMELLRQAAVTGPYALVLGPEAHRSLDGAGEGGYPVVSHVKRLIGGPVVWAPALRGGVLVSQRGGDFRYVCGSDATIGYVGHDEETVRLYFEESFSAELLGPEAAVPLLPAPAPD